MTTVADLLRARADDDHIGLRFEDRSWTWREIVAECEGRAAVALELRDGRRPFHIGVLLDNAPDYLFWIGGAAVAGATVVGINPTRRGAELAADICHTDCQLVVTHEEHRPLLDDLDIGVSRDRVIDAGTSAHSPPAAVAAAAATAEESHQLLLLFTSGSTGAPKAVICSQGRLAGTAAAAQSMLGITRDDVLYQSMPLFHGNAIMVNILPALAAGATIALRRRFSASGFLPDVRAFGATYFNYVGRALAYILATPESDPDADNSLRTAFGTEASARDIEQFEARFGCRIIEGYGSSEGIISIHRVPGCPAAALGKPQDLPGIDIAVVDPVTGRECPPARIDAHGALLNANQAIGEIVNRAGAARFEGYYKNDAAVQSRLRDGWYWSGDLAYRDEDGWYYFAGRTTDWLRVDSENFAAAPIERILARFPTVVMVAVYAVPDVRTGDQVMAALEFAPGAAFEPVAFRAFLDAQPDLGTKWLPRFVRSIAAMPLLANNKVDKGPLRRVQWAVDDPVWWRPAGEAAYRRLTPSDVAGLRAELAEHGRAHLVPAR